MKRINNVLGLILFVGISIFFAGCSKKAEPGLKNCSYCIFKGCCGNDPSSSKGREQINTGSGSEYGKTVANCEKAAEPTKSGKPRKDYGYDEVTKVIGADKSMSRDDRRAILAMKDILDGKDIAGDGG